MEKTVAAIKATGLALLMVLRYVAALLVLPAAVLALSWGLGVDVFNAIVAVAFLGVAVYAGYNSVKSH